MKKSHPIWLLPVFGALAVLMTFALLLALVYFFDNKYTAGPPYGQDGVLEFTQDDLSRPLFLVDGWNLNGQEVFIGQYSNFSFLPGGTSPFGEGRYHLTLRYDGSPTTLLMEIPPIFTEYTLSINGVPAAQSRSDTAVAAQNGSDTAAPSKAESNHTVTPQIGDDTAAPSKAESRAAVTSQIGDSAAAPSKAESDRTVTPQIGDGTAAPSKAESRAAVTSQIGDGTAAPSKAESRAAVTSQIGDDAAVAVPVGNGDTTLELDTVNQSHYYSGLTYPPAIGTPGVMNRLFLIRTLIYAILCVTALTLACFSLMLWISRARDALFRQFGILCLAFAIHCLHPFVWQLFGYSALWYAVEDASWLLVLAQAAALGALCTGLERKVWYRRGLRPLTVIFCFFCFCSVLFIIPEAAKFVNFYGEMIDWYKRFIWLWLAFCAASGLSRRPGWTSFFILSACGVLGASLLAGMGDSNAFEPIYGAWQNEYAGFVLVLLFGGLMVRRNAKLLQESAQLQSVKLQNRFAVESAVQTRSSIAQVRSLKHELRHHVETLEALYAAGDYARLGEYLTQLGEEKEALPQLYYAENFLVNAILTGRLGPAQEHGIRVECRASVPEDLSIADSDLCTLLSNLLDNAVEACERLTDSDDRSIKLTLEVRQELFLLTCVNSASLQQHNKGNGDRFSTSKSDRDNHGLGIPAMRRTAEKYDGVLEVSQTDGTFTLKAVLHLPQAMK